MESLTKQTEVISFRIEDELFKRLVQNGINPHQIAKQLFLEKINSVYNKIAEIPNTNTAVSAEDELDDWGLPKNRPRSDKW